MFGTHPDQKAFRKFFGPWRAAERVLVPMLLLRWDLACRTDAVAGATVYHGLQTGPGLTRLGRRSASFKHLGAYSPPDKLECCKIQEIGTERRP